MNPDRRRGVALQAGMTMTETAPAQPAPKLDAVTRTSSRGGFVAEVTLPATAQRGPVTVTSEPQSTRETALTALRLELRRHGVRL